MTTETKLRKHRTPRNYDSIIKGALAMPLQARVELMAALKQSIDAEVQTLQEAAKQAAKIANGGIS